MVTADEQTGGNAKSALQDADISLLRADSSFIAGMSSGPKGEFEFSNIKKGNYLLKLSSIGYEQIWITLKGLHKDLDLTNKSEFECPYYREILYICIDKINRQNAQAHEQRYENTFRNRQIFLKRW
jgi:hypothetical protein